MGSKSEKKSKPVHKWIFRPRFRREAFGWRSQPAIQRIKEAISEIKKVARRDPVLGAEGAVLFLEKVSPALVRIDSSSGHIGAAVNHAIATLAPIIAKAPAEDKRRDKWLDRLWDAVEEDNIPYIELLPDYWGDLCATPERASRWADDFIGTVRLVWDPSQPPGGWFRGTTACLSCLLSAGRHRELLDLIERAPYKSWHIRQWGIKALVALGRKEEALDYAENSRGINEPSGLISRACEEILLSMGRPGEAYQRYAFEANWRSTYLARFRAIAAKYPDKAAADILKDLVASTPGEEGKWFAAAKAAGLYEEAAALAERSPCDPRTLSRAARDYAASRPEFAIRAGLAALRWMARGHGYELTSIDVNTAFRHTMEAAGNAGCREETLERMRRMIAHETDVPGLVFYVLEKKLQLKQ